MACLCKNLDGSLSEICFGVCQGAIKDRPDNSIENRIEYLLGMFLDKLDNRIERLELLVNEKYKQGFLDGFYSGRDS